MTRISAALPKQRLTCILLGISIGAAATISWAGNESRYEAFPLDDGLFEVVADFSENAIYWCGAGLYAQKQMKKSATERIYVWRGPGPSNAKPNDVSVRFGFTPP